jgi:hypothetical protein
MEALKAEIASKRKAIQDDPIDRRSKYMKRGDLEKLREERELATLQAQTSPEGLPSMPTRVSTRSSFKIVCVLTRQWRTASLHSSIFKHFSTTRYKISESC